MTNAQETAPIHPGHALSTKPTRVLGVLSLVLIGLAFNGVMNIFTSYGLVTQATDGHLAAGYAFATLAMAVTAVSYISMSRIVKKGGSAYAYTEKAFGSRAGFMVGWTILLDYLFTPMVCFLLLGIYLNAQFPSVPVWLFTLLGIVITFIANLLGTKFVSRAGGALISTTFVIIVVFVLLGLFHSGASFADGMASLVPTPGELPIVFSGVSLLAVSFAGFDVISTMSEEAKDPGRTIPRATLITVLVMGAGFVAISFVGAMVEPGTDFANVDAAGLEVMKAVGGPLLGAAFLIVYICSLMASALVSQASAARIIYTMGRDGVLPKRLFGTLVTKSKIPMGGFIVASLIGLIALFVTVENSFIMLAFGMLVAFCAVNLATFKYFIFDLHKRGFGNLVRYGVLPLVGFGMTMWLWSTLSGATFVFGLSWVAVGFAYLAYSTRFFRTSPPVIDFSEV
ncbi:APC family permease [Rhodococcus jostii]|uniref:APC family permease n=1 Tax=Rhodococcus jostii TaxID=132919 RepID=A0ABU4CSB8_RHOJO|nr:APC family permease [Rhodococcus jostii]MDV6286476.1 APC family permease [Rhodococcus jostii]